MTATLHPPGKNLFELRESLHSPRMRCLLFALVAALTLVGCGSKREEQSQETREDQKIIVTTTVAEKTVAGADGNPVVVEVIKTTTTSEEKSAGKSVGLLTSTTTLTLPPIIEAIPKLVTDVVKGSPAGPWVTMVGYATAAQSGFWAVKKQTEAKANKDRAEEHKLDAAEGWAHVVGERAATTKVVAPELEPKA